MLQIVWDSGPAICTRGLVLRILTGLLPLAALAVARLIIKLVVEAVKHPGHRSRQRSGGCSARSS